MSRDDYRQALDAACRELEALLAKRAELDGRVAQLHETIGALSRLCGLTPSVPWGLTGACRVVLRRAEQPLSPVAIRDRLRGIGFDLARYSNELAALHTTLKRLVASGEVKAVTRPSGERVYAAVRVRAMSLERALELAELEIPGELGRNERKP